MSNQELLNNWIDQKKAVAKENGLSFFQGIPETWFDNPTWICENGHLHSSYLKSEILGSICFLCSKPVRLFPKNGTIEEFQKLINKP